MPMKKIVANQALLLRLDSLRNNRLVLVVPSGIITGIPIFIDDDSTSALEETVASAVEKLTPPCSDDALLRGNDTVFMLRDVHIWSGDKHLEHPFLFVRYDSVIACTLGDF